MLRDGEMTSKVHFRAKILIFFRFFSQAFFHSELDGEWVSRSLEHAKRENHEKKIIQINFKGGEMTTKMDFHLLHFIFFNFFSWEFFHSDFDGEWVSYGLGNG